MPVTSKVGLTAVGNQVKRVTYSEKKKKKAFFRSILEQMFQITTTAVKKIADKNAAETGVCGQKLQASS